MRELKAAHRRLERSLILDVMEEARSAESGTHNYGFENIMAVGISDKVVNGRPSADPCVTVYVATKVPLDQVHQDARVPDRIKGIPTDVVRIGNIRAAGGVFVGTYRPALGGVSVSCPQVGAGTIACLVQKGNTTCVLSNNHVLANVNQGQQGDPILQPGVSDGGQAGASQIGTLLNFVTIDFANPNSVDCAIASVLPVLVSPLLEVLGQLQLPTVTAQKNMPVKKVGRSTGSTSGLVTDVNATAWIDYGTSGTAVFRNQVIVRSSDSNSFSEDGDSGALVVSNSNQPVALLAGLGVGFSIANPIDSVLSALGVTIIA